MIAAIIPARGGSKRIPGKNHRPFAGKPMIAYTLETAAATRLFDRILVSTDAPEIAAVARAHGAEVPFVRPPELSDDHTPTAPVVAHALAWLDAQGTPPDAVCCMYATAPLMQAADVIEGHRLLRASGAGAALSVTTFDFPILRAFRRAADGHVEWMWPEHALTRSNDLPAAYHDAGQFYWLDAARFRADPTLISADARAVVLPRWRVQDIDTPEDWEIAEKLFELQRSR